MRARFTLSLLLAAQCCLAGTAEPKARPRLTPPIADQVKMAVVRDPSDTPGFRSFDSYLQTQARRPVGLEAVPEVAAARSEAAEAKKQATAAPDSSPPLVQTDPGRAEILVLPKVEVTSKRLTELQKELAALEANQAWESRSAEAWENTTVLGAILNPPFLKLGGYSSSGHAAVARRRVELLTWVKILTISLEEAKTPEEKARIRADIDGIKDIMRNWD